MKSSWLTHTFASPVLMMLSALFLVSCASDPIPNLKRLYGQSTSGFIQPSLNQKEGTGDFEQPPLILIHGAFGARLCDNDGAEHWPGGIKKLLFSDYTTLALDMQRESQAVSTLTPCGMTDEVAGRDFYGRIEETLSDAGGYALTREGATVSKGPRRLYRYVYDWRQDNARSAADLDALVEQIRRDHNDPDLKVDIVAHSMGGLVTRYWLRYGTIDVLSDNNFPINNVGGEKVRKVILVGTPNLGSTSALQQLVDGAKIGVNTLPPELLLTFPSAYQLLPHPIANPILGDSGRPLSRDIFDIEIWRALEWGPFDPRLRQRTAKMGLNDDDLKSLSEYAHTHLERARRFVWSLTVANPERPYSLIVFGGDCVSTPARILIEDNDDVSNVRLWPNEISEPSPSLNYDSLMLEPGDGAVTKASLLGRATLDPSIPRHRFSYFPLDYTVMFCEDHSQLPGNLTFQDNLLHILLSR